VTGLPAVAVPGPRPAGCGRGPVTTMSGSAIGVR